MSYQKETDAIWDMIQDLWPSANDNEAPNSLTTEMELFERSRLIQALEYHDWNQSKAAKELGIGRTNLIAKIKKYKLIRMC
jgi:transcriptional regulator with GAF, ATPase, and Fis domain|tara:strand:+ start:1530 stop:1772 length:243 start_codon:yes stop_codon:yes gene_type:complete